MPLHVTLPTILADPVVVEDMRRAFSESNAGRPDAVEQGGFILQDIASARLSVARVPASECDSIAFPLCANGQFQGLQIVGSFHTHPNLGPEWQQEPSEQDCRLSIEYPETVGPHHFVISQDSVYHIDNDGTVTVIGVTSQVLQFQI